MASAIVLDGPPPSRKRGLAGPPAVEGCRCVKNKRTGRGVQLCPVPRSRKHRSGWKFTGTCQP